MIESTFRLISIHDGSVEFNDHEEVLFQKMTQIAKTCLSWNPFVYVDFRPLTHDLKCLDHKKLQSLLNIFFIRLIEENHSDPIAVLDRLASVIPVQHLLNESDTPLSILNEAKAMFDEAEYYFKIKAESNPNRTTLDIHKCIRGIISLIGSIIKLFDITTLIDPGQMPSDAEQARGQLGTMVQLFTLLSAILSATLIHVAASAATKKVVTASVLCLGALAILWKFIEPIPWSLSRFMNLSEKTQDNGVQYFGRELNLDILAKMIELNNNVLIIAPPHTGKTHFIESFAKKLSQGAYPKLIGKQVHTTNTPTDLSNKEAAEFVNTLCRQMGRHADDFILVLDNIQNACKGKNMVLAGELHPHLASNGKLRHVIGLIPESEYQKMVKTNPSFVDRFEKIFIQSTTESETHTILLNHAIQKNKDHIIQLDAIKLIYEFTKKKNKTPQPLASLQLLDKCIAETEITQQSEEYTTRKKREMEKFALLVEGAFTGDKVIPVEPTKKELRCALQEAGIAKKAEILFRAKDLLASVKAGYLHTAIKISKIAQKKLHSSESVLKKLNLNEEKQLKRYLLLKHILEKNLNSYIIQKSNEVKLNIFINKELVEKVYTT